MLGKSVRVKYTFTWSKVKRKQKGNFRAHGGKGWFPPCIKEQQSSRKLAKDMKEDQRRKKKWFFGAGHLALGNQYDFPLGLAKPKLTTTTTKNRCGVCQGNGLCHKG